jgi:hypothetical protein
MFILCPCCKIQLSIFSSLYLINVTLMDNCKAAYFSVLYFQMCSLRLSQNRSFPPRFHHRSLWLGPQGNGGTPANHELPNQTLMDRHQLFYISKMGNSSIKGFLPKFMKKEIVVPKIFQYQKFHIPIQNCFNLINYYSIFLLLIPSIYFISCLSTSFLDDFQRNI